MQSHIFLPVRETLRTGRPPGVSSLWVSGCWTCGCEDTSPERQRSGEVTGAVLRGWKCSGHCWCAELLLCQGFTRFFDFLNLYWLHLQIRKVPTLSFVVCGRFQRSIDLGAQYFSDLCAKRLSYISVDGFSPPVLAQVPGKREGAGEPGAEYRRVERVGGFQAGRVGVTE